MNNKKYNVFAVVAMLCSGVIGVFVLASSAAGVAVAEATVHEGNVSKKTASEKSPSIPDSLQVQALSLPTLPGSQYPHLFAVGDQVYLSWLQKGENGNASLWFSILAGTHWSAPQRIASGANWFVNWADFPSMVALQDGTLVAHWLEKSAPDTYAYDVRMVYSSDLGKHWSAPFSPHDDGTATEHGFVSLLPQPDNTLSVVWLDGRQSKGDHEQMQLRHARFNQVGKKLSEQVIDSDTCTCCQTSAAAAKDGVVVAYRDHSVDEIRDIAWLQLRGERWSKPRLVHADGWEIPGCPVNGPALASVDQQLAVAWFTAAQELPRVQLAFASNADNGFAAPIRVDDGAPLGRVSVVMPTARSAVVSWLERDGENARLRVRQFSRDNAETIHAGEPLTVAVTSIARSSGFPRLALRGEELVIAWTEVSEQQSSQIRTARLMWRDLH